MRRVWAALLGLLLAAGMLAGAVAEDADPSELPLSTQTDLCPHEHVREVFYFDHPTYRAINRYVHDVVGSAVVNVVCDDCGEVLSSETRDHAEEQREHTYNKKGVCRLCGYVRQEASPTEVPAVQEQVLQPLADESGKRWEIAVTGDMVSALRADKMEVLVIRPEGSPLALAVVLSAEVEKALANGPLNAALEALEDDSWGAELLVDGKENVLPENSCSLRLYEEEKEKAEELKVFFVPEEAVAAGNIEEAETEAPAPVWNRPAGSGTEGYWNVDWLGDGTYRFQ